MNYYVVDGPIVKIYSDETDKVITKNTNTCDDLTDEDKFGICCALIADGLDLQKAATGAKWRLSKGEFLRMASMDDKLNLMYFNAKERRVNSLVEKMLVAEDEKELKKLKIQIEICKKEILDDRQNQKGNVKYFIGSYLPDGKQKELTENARSVYWDRKTEDSPKESSEESN